ncbi:hypothetical protein B0J14DRAFT_701589 [Halenospora varia]|nr:hypothetical protein B0J14DRAFT_701589 [Halenospora varia]
MWILECDGDALNGKKLWLRPGKKFVFGRTKSEGTWEIGEIAKFAADRHTEGQFVISDKTISRQHCMVHVENVEDGDCAHPRTRSKIWLKDLDTKIGTLLNGEQIKGKTCQMFDEDNVVALGRYKHNFHFKWVPVVFTFSFTSKEHRADPYTDLYKALGPLDIKVLVEYERGVTTHLVAKKRNTSKGLQALLDGKYIVHNDSYINAVVAAASPNEEGYSLLEEDFTSFPDPLEYLPPKGGEPTEHSDNDYAPNPARQDIFEGYTFIFYEQRQFDTLLAPITEGAGKALLKQAIPNETTVEEFVRYVKAVAGEKGLGEFEDGSEGKGVVVVRFNPVKGAGAEWFSQFSTQVALYLDHRLIEQNEFLDAILSSDARMLRRPLEVESSGIVAPPPSTAGFPASQTFRSSQLALAPPVAAPAPAQPAAEPVRRGRARRTTAPKFKGFDDDDFAAPPILNSIPEAMVIESVPTPAAESQGLFVSQDANMEVEREASHPPAAVPRNTRKRRATPVDFDENEDIAPAAAALKRRKLAESAARRQRGESTPAPERETLAPPEIKDEPMSVSTKPSRRKKKPEEADLLEAAREQQERAEALAREERESLQDLLQGMDISEIRNLAKIEEIEVKRVYAPKRATRADESERWDEKWNGRKDFKKFRRRGAESQGLRRRFEKVIVPLEVAQKKDFGIGDEYWGDEPSDQDPSQPSRNKKRKKSKLKDDSQKLGRMARPVKLKFNKAGKEIENSGPDSDDEEFLVASEESDDARDFPANPAQARVPAVRKERTPVVEVQSSSPARPPAKSSRTQASASSVQPDAEDDEDEAEIVQPKPRASRSQKSAPPAKKLAAKPANVPAKRGAPKAATAREPPKKRQKQLGLVRPGRDESEDEDEDSDDGLKFRFKR